MEYHNIIDCLVQPILIKSGSVDTTEILYQC